MIHIQNDYTTKTSMDTMMKITFV